MTTAGKNIMLGTAGHVDHGKTALVKLLTGCETDRLAEEKRRGLTIELGFAPCAMADERIVGIVDVPGHVGFIKNMVAAAHGIDVVMLVVAADDGVMPQTREHLDILTLMGTQYGLVALTKVDLIDEEMLELVTDDIREFVAGTFLENKPICPVSSITGEGFQGFYESLNAEVDGAEAINTGGFFRQWIEKEFSIHGFGKVITGIPSSGEVRLGDSLRILPGDHSGRVRKVQVYGHEAETGRAGECVALNLSDVHVDEIGRGSILVEGDIFRPVSMFEAELTVLPSTRKELEDFRQVHLHVGTAESMARVVMLEGEPVAPGGKAFVQMRCDRPIPVALGERFIIRATASSGILTTIGGGRICSVSDKKLRRKRPWLLESLRQFRDALDNPGQWITQHLLASGCACGIQELSRRTQVRTEDTEKLLSGLAAEGLAVAVSGGRYIHRQVVDSAASSITDALGDFHRDNPMRGGEDPTKLRTGLDLEPEIFSAAVSALTEKGSLEKRGELLAMPGAEVDINSEDRELFHQLDEILRQSGLTPPRPDELAGSCNCDQTRLDKLLQLLCDEGHAVKLDPKVVMHIESVNKARETVFELFDQGGGFETVEFRNALGVSRKYAVPLLDYFDSVRLTHRTGSRRKPGKEAK